MVDCAEEAVSVAAWRIAGRKGFVGRFIDIAIWVPASLIPEQDGSCAVS